MLSGKDGFAVNVLFPSSLYLWKTCSGDGFSRRIFEPSIDGNGKLPVHCHCHRQLAQAASSRQRKSRPESGQKKGFHFSVRKCIILT